MSWLRGVFMSDATVVSPVSPGSKGAINELTVTVDLMKKGFEVFQAASPNSSCDLIALKNGYPVRIEVKGRTLAKHRSKLSTSWKSKHYDARRFEVLAAVCGTDVQYKRSMFHALNPASEELVLNKINGLDRDSILIEGQRERVG
jgi:hypothetical protein